MVRDRKRFADTGRWEWAQFDYDPASATFTPNTSLQSNYAKFGFADHTIVKAKDYVFTTRRGERALSCAGPVLSEM
jgi:Cytochrome P460